MILQPFFVSLHFLEPILMETTPKISIIVPVYNMEKYLRQCVDSILAQTFKDFELLLVNDGSKDSSPQICDEYAAADARVRVIHKENSGQADSRNIAIKEAKAPLIGFVDSDDWIDPDMYETLYNTLVSTGADISICGYYMSYVNKEVTYCSGEGVTIFDRDQAMLLLLRDKKLKSFLWDKLFRREVITADMPKSYRYEDYSTLIKWFASADKVSMCFRPEYHYRQRQGSTDHEVNPVRMWHFFLAEIERCSYVRKFGSFSEVETELEERVVDTGVAQAKDIARACDYATAVRYAGKIAQEMRNFGCVQIRADRLRLRWRMQLLFRSPEQFVKMMRISRFLKLSRRNQSKGFYE